ncbi:MAG: carboxypeptidase PM20D1 [Planctomycetota bacterium]|jgi:carboxypeptidase PM20D1
MKAPSAKGGLILVFLGILLVSVVMLARTILLEPAPSNTRRAAELKIDVGRVCDRLGRVIQFQTVSSVDPDSLEVGRRSQLLNYLERTFVPLIEQLDYERHEHGIVFRWDGTDPELAPLLLLGHLDVVPVDPATRSEWIQEPFSGAIATGHVWGRGALDDKGSSMAMLEALEGLLRNQFRPRRGVIVALGLDEEIGGVQGAARMAAEFEEEGLRPFMILDEGMAILEGVIDAVPGPVAGVGVAEKGFLTVELLVEELGGHSSMPEKQTSLGILAAAISALEKEPMSAGLDGAAGLFFDELAREMEFGPKFLFSNRWITEPILWRILSRKPTTDALLRTTTAVTTAQAGVADNVLPQVARATANFRIHPRDSVEEVLAHVARVIDDQRVQINVLGESFEPSEISPTDGAAWALLSQTIKECFDGVMVAPTLVLAATDSRHYAHLSPHVYRFNGLRLGPNDLPRIHGVNERISTKNYVEMIRFYMQLVRNG